MSGARSSAISALMIDVVSRFDASPVICSRLPLPMPEAPVLRPAMELVDMGVALIDGAVGGGLERLIGREIEENVALQVVDLDLEPAALIIDPEADVLVGGGQLVV